MIDNIGPLLARLPDPESPSTLAATVMARVAREAERRSEQGAVPAPQHRERLSWIRVVAGALVVLAIIVHAWLTAGSVPDVASWRVGVQRLVLIPVEGPAALLIGAGVLLYVTGLFAPLRR